MFVRCSHIFLSCLFRVVILPPVFKHTPTHRMYFNPPVPCSLEAPFASSFGQPASRSSFLHPVSSRVSGAATCILLITHPPHHARRLFLTASHALHAQTGPGCRHEASRHTLQDLQDIGSQVQAEEEEEFPLESPLVTVAQGAADATQGESAPSAPATHREPPTPHIPGSGQFPGGLWEGHACPRRRHCPLRGGLFQP